jgi:hypothetical protein
MTHGHMNVEIETKAAQFLEKEHINGSFLAMHGKSIIPVPKNYLTLGGHFHQTPKIYLYKKANAPQTMIT